MSVLLIVRRVPKRGLDPWNTPRRERLAKAQCPSVLRPDTERRFSGDSFLGNSLTSWATRQSPWAGCISRVLCPEWSQARAITARFGRLEKINEACEARDSPNDSNRVAGSSDEVRTADKKFSDLEAACPGSRAPQRVTAASRPPEHGATYATRRSTSAVALISCWVTSVP